MHDFRSVGHFVTLGAATVGCGSWGSGLFFVFVANGRCWSGFDPRHMAVASPNQARLFWNCVQLTDLHSENGPAVQMRG